ncbi:hypothetical protein HN415_10005 [Candidatus Woesearchaeota archaeon]|jgi:hypothetical protein|nr:hypothetical protein [Candidatus Woesearchaeota archaeon]
MNEINLAGFHINTTLGYLTNPKFKIWYEQNMHTSAQKKWAKEIYKLYQNNEIEYINVISTQDSICELCDDKFKKKECYNIIEKWTIEGHNISIGKNKLSDLIAIFNPEKFLKNYKNWIINDI